jgi:hypothetical protein
VSAQYHFFSWLRRGAAAYLAAPAAGTARAIVPAEIEIRADGMEGHASATDTVTRDVQLFGPSDVKGFDASAVLVSDPPADSGDFEPNYLCSLRFHAGDFPWRFSPTVADATGNLLPWVVLLVLAREEVTKKVPGNEKAPPLIYVAASHLPKLTDSWRWAHAQVVHDGAVDEAALKTLLQDEPHKVTSRLLCGRRLQPNKRYEAYVVPAFAAGVAAATGNEPAGMTSVTPAWADDAQGTIILPCYYQWEFGTGASGDFESMVLELKPNPLGDIGVRDFACGDPGFDVGDGQPLTLKLEGAIRSVKSANPAALGSPWGHDAVPPTATAYHAELAAVLNQPAADVVNRASADDPVVGPPIYGRWHAARTSVLVRRAPPPSAAPSIHWVDQLNLDPRHRAAAGLGARVAEKTQEAFMASAWRQVGEVERANDLIRRAQLAREASATLHRRFQVLPFERKAGFLAPAAKRVMGADNVQTLAAKLGARTSAAAALDPAFRRVSRARGSIAKRQSAEKRLAAGGLLARLQAVRPLRAAGIAPAPRGAPTWSSVGKQVAAVNAPAAAIAVGEREIQSTIGASIKALAGTPVGDRYGTAVQLDALAASVSETMTGFLSGGQADDAAAASPIKDFDAEFARPILAALDPEKSIARKVKALLGRRPPPKAGADELAPILAAPDFPQPMYEDLRELSQQYLMPGAEKVPQNAVAILEMNRRFVEAYLAGLNHEFARELRWREYPTDQRGTYFRRFWDSAPGAAGAPANDIRRMHEWGRALGNNSEGQVANPAMVLIRGNLLRRYPHTLIYVVEANAQGMPVIPDDTHPALEPIFSATLPPDMFFFGFNMEPAKLKTGGAAGKGYFVVFEECLGDTRFGADEASGQSQGCADNWNKLDWSYIQTSTESGYISAAPCATNDSGVKWQSAAQVAWILQQWPMRVYMHANQLLPPEV